VTAFSETLSLLETHTSQFFVTDRTDEQHPVTVFNKELFFASLSPQMSPFYFAFSQTTMFQEFIDKKMDEKSRDWFTT
jgi:hypothetical protein